MAQMTGPAAILEASRYVELYDDELDEEPWRLGIHTLPPWLPDRMEPEAPVRDVRRPDGLRGGCHVC